MPLFRLVHAHRVVVITLATLVALGANHNAHAAGPARSHTPLRTLSVPPQRPVPMKGVYYVDAAKGDDTAAGTLAAPWKSVQRSLMKLKPGDTLCLRGGTYRESLYLALQGTREQPITIRSAPGEEVVIDGGLAEFFDSPATAWEPCTDGAPGEYRSTGTYPNQRQFIGSFGDSMIGLQTYYHRQDLTADNELADPADPTDTESKKGDLKPLYCGPGIWYDHVSGRIHARLAHTHQPEGVDNYQGATDPRQLPLVIAPFATVNVRLDEAKHVKLQDLVFRGGGYHSIWAEYSNHIELNNVTIWCGTYGIRASGLTNLHMIDSRMYGSLAPWTCRADASKRDYPGRSTRNITRLNTHALIELEAGKESSVYYTPQNDLWEIEGSHFADAHDGLYLGAIQCRFHHNLIENLQDDGLYLSPMYLRHKLDKTNPQIHVYENIFRQLLTGVAFGGAEATTNDEIFIYRNWFDLTRPVYTTRANSARPQVGLAYGKLVGDHGSPPWPEMAIYHNTVISRESCRDVAMTAQGALRAGVPRRVFNNIFWHEQRLPGFVPPALPESLAADGDVYWSPGTNDAAAAGLFARYLKSPAFEAGKKAYAAGSTTHARVAPPFENPLQIELSAGSAAINAGVRLPEGLPDSLVKRDDGEPDAGALPLSVKVSTLGPQGVNAARR